MPTRFAANGNDAIDFRGKANGWTIDALQCDDIVYGTMFDDTLWGREGEGRLHGERGDDVIWGGEGRDLALGGDGNDHIQGDAETLTRRWSYHPNQSGDADRLFSGDGDDYVVGQGGDDALSVSAGNDRLESFESAGRLTDRAGADHFQYSAEDFIAGTVIINDVPVSTACRSRSTASRWTRLPTLWEPRATRST